jgi:hypothetical protein
VGVRGDPDPAKLVHDFKSYATRALKSHGHQPAGARWWTESGSRRKLPDERAVRAAVEYVLRQYLPLVIWSGERGVSTPCHTAAGERGVSTPCSTSRLERDPIQGVNAPHLPGESRQGVNTPRSPGESRQGVNTPRSPEAR